MVTNHYRENVLHVYLDGNKNATLLNLMAFLLFVKVIKIHIHLITGTGGCFNPHSRERTSYVSYMKVTAPQNDSKCLQVF